LTAEHSGGQPGEQPTWLAKPIRDMTAKELVDAIRYLDAATATADEVLERAIHTELTLRQAGIRPGRTTGTLDETRLSAHR
jgi:hypothetical protein